MPFISYAQNLEDVILWRALGDYSPGFYIDIGAHDPIIDSVTKAFYEAGWLGINVEPLKNCFEKLFIDRPRDINLNIAVDSSKGKREFYEIGDEIGLSTLVAKYAEEHANTTDFKIKKYTVETTTLADICHNFVEEGQAIHFLKIDIEGSEKAVLEGTDFKNYRPWIIVIEATQPRTTLPSFLDWEPILLNAAYTFIYFDGLNRFYIANEKFEMLRHHFLSPPNVFDEYTAYNTVVALTGAANQLADTENQLADTRNHLTDTENQLADIENQLADTKSQLADTESQLADTENQLADARNQLAILLASCLWQ